jgi:hypothetical protein
VNTPGGREGGALSGRGASPHETAIHSFAPLTTHGCFLDPRDPFLSAYRQNENCWTLVAFGLWIADLGFHWRFGIRISDLIRHLEFVIHI